MATCHDRGAPIPARRPAHPLVPYRRTGPISDALHRALRETPDDLVLTVVAFVRDRYDGAEPSHDVLRFDRLALVTSG